MINDIFKTPLYNTIFDHLNQSEMIDYCLKYREDNPSDNRSNINGYQSKPLEGIHLPLNEMFKDIDYTCNAFCQRIGMRMPTFIQNCWININGPNSYNTEHRHPLAMVSGVFYISVPENSGDIVFTNPTEKMDMFWGKYFVDNFTPYNSVCSIHKPKDMELLLFPSYLTHRVDINKSNEDRISISFNCVPINS